eukprot:10032157-Alexandrium_andersonii.AAC.1
MSMLRTVWDMIVSLATPGVLTCRVATLNTSFFSVNMSSLDISLRLRPAAELASVDTKHTTS